MSKEDALYYLEEITKNYLNLPYLTHGDSETEAKQLLTEGIDNIDASVEEIDENFSPEDPLTIEVMEVANFVKGVSEKYLEDNDVSAISDSSYEVGYMIGAISTKFLDGELPHTIEKVSEDFSEIDKSENSDNENEIYSEEIKLFIEDYNNLTTLEDDIDLIEKVQPAEETKNGYTQTLYSSDEYIIIANYEEDGEVDFYVVVIPNDQPYRDLQGNGLYAMFHVAATLDLDLEELGDEFEKALPNHAGMYFVDDYTIIFSTDDQLPEMGITIMFMNVSFSGDE
ncbi:hypothetical protein ACS127_03375 [Amphibacillus sp. Q70]|uniref:hypothetical protein n=1 Tax=Amphibacillus sp. Q70 TaxID=3453416 RepID=UPI003F82923B